MTEQTLIYAGLGLLLVLDLLASAAQVAFAETSHARLLAARDEHGGVPIRTLQLLTIKPRLLACLSLFLLLGRFWLAALVLLVVRSHPSAAPGLVVFTALLAAALGLFWLEWVLSRNIAAASERWAVRLTPFVRVMLLLFSWLVSLPLALSRRADSSLDTSATVTEDELKNLVDAGQEEGVFEQGERRMIYSIFRLSNTLAREIMVPRIDMLALEVSTPLAEAVDALLAAGHSRAPVYRESVDNTLGLLYAKDLLRAWRQGSEVDSLAHLLRPAYFVPEAKRVDDLLSEMQSQRIHMAVVVDEYGGVAGLVTLEDIVEEILGEIWDEYDQGEELPYQALKDGSYLFLGRVDLDNFNEVMGSNLPKDEAETLGGFVYNFLGRVPFPGESLQAGGLQLTVEQVSVRRIRKVRARWIEAGDQPPAQPHTSTQAGDHVETGRKESGNDY